MAAAAGLIGLAACTGPVPAPAGALIGPDDLLALQRTVQQINDSSTGPDQQRATLDRLVADDQRTEQEKCRPATTTVEFEPAWIDAKPTTGQPGSYTVPTLIRVITGGRITGTDLTALVLTIDQGVARTTALCVS